MAELPHRKSVHAFTRAWPAVVALGAVVVIALGMLGVDILVDRESGARTDALVNNALRSVALVGDLRYQANRLIGRAAPRDERAVILANIRADSQAYAPLTTYAGEHDEWLHLQGLLARAQTESPLPPGAAVVQEIEDSVDRLVAINEQEAASLAGSIDRINSSGILLDLVLGALIIAAAGAITWMLMRSYRSERELLALHLASLDDRAQELEAFGSRVAHDLKGPLSPIVFASDVLANSPHEDVRPMARRVSTSAMKMADMIDDLLSLSVAGRPPMGTTEVAPVVNDLLDELEPELAGAEVATVLSPCKVACPGEVLSRVLRNLIGNASKYRARDRRLALEIDATCARDLVEIVVADNGIGMDEDTRQHAFDPFFRAKEASGVAGHGLGLAIVKRTVESLGGACHLESSPGQGTRVALELPAA
jgi:signal transduction histidine kinase